MADNEGLLPHSGSTDATLLTTIGDGDSDAFAEAYDRHGGVIYGFALRLCGRGLAEQMTRDVFLSLWRCPEEFVLSEGSLRMPLLVRTHTRVAELADGEPPRFAPAAHLDRAGADTLSQLPSAEQIAIALTCFGGLTYEQAAAVVQRPKNMVAEDIRTGLNHLAAA